MKGKIVIESTENLLSDKIRTQFGMELSTNTMLRAAEKGKIVYALLHAMNLEVYEYEYIKNCFNLNSWYDGKRIEFKSIQDYNIDELHKKLADALEFVECMEVEDDNENRC